MKIRSIIVEDEPHARDVLKIYLQDINEIELIETCGNGADAVQAITSKKPDLVFLDIQIPEFDGFEVIRQIGKAKMPVIIFVTAYDRYAVRAFETHALDYLLKPFSQDRFNQATKRAIEVIRTSQVHAVNERILHLLEDREHALTREDRTVAGMQRRLTVKEGGKITFIQVADIDWIEAAGDYIKLHIGKTSHLLHETMNAIETKLNPKTFLRIHRSTIVNTDRIKELQPHDNSEYFIQLNDGTRLKLSRSYRRHLEQFLSTNL